MDSPTCPVCRCRGGGLGADIIRLTCTAAIMGSGVACSADPNPPVALIFQNYYRGFFFDSVSRLQFYYPCSLSLSICSCPGFPLARQQSYMHQYHYPNLETAEEDGRLKHPRFVRVGSGRLVSTCGTRDAIRNRMIAQNALLDPPVQQPYVNNTLEEEDDENLDFDPSRHHHPMGRRVNSLESLQQIFRQGPWLLFARV
ncbi:unnamed protein product [Dibothriocephalus latus]|uniref:Uncharacterized protein n=1 Tax=Dibothriocephalus latus TaxID=60516 RepID=A0A3P7N5F2_DIBLA|nr:unnamed protein product [Dibothriocephalus latus]